METESLQAILYWAMNAGAGWLNKWLVDLIAREKEEDGEPISPKTKRRLSWLLSAAIPTVLYLAYSLLLAYEPYKVEAHILAVLAAFGVSQAIHGERDLPSGVEVKARERMIRHGDR